MSVVGPIVDNEEVLVIWSSGHRVTVVDAGIWETSSARARETGDFIPVLQKCPCLHTATRCGASVV